MITDILIFTLTSTVQGLSTFLPPYSWLPFPVDMQNGLDWVVTACASWNSVLPLTQLFSVIVFLISFEAILFGFRIIVFVYDKIRGSG